MSRRGLVLGLIVLGTVSPLGCSDSSPMASVAEFSGRAATAESYSRAAKAVRSASPAPSMPGMGGSMMAGGAMGFGRAPMPSTPPETPPAEVGTSATPIPPALDRKIVYNALVDMNVENLSSSEKGLTALVQQSKGYISETDVSGNTGARRRGSWKVRVPVEQFGNFMAAVVKLGELEKTHQDSEEVTAEFYDIEARIKNKQQEESRLKKILEEATGKLKEILDVEKEISRVRGEIEQMQGRLRVLTSLTSMSTITVTMTEVENFKPIERPTFGQMIARTFAQSTERLTNYLGGLVLAVVDFIPWLTLWVPFLAAIWVVARVVRRRLKSRPRGEPAIPPTPSVTS